MKYIPKFCLSISQYMFNTNQCAAKGERMVNHYPLYPIARLRLELFGEILLILILKL